MSKIDQQHLLTCIQEVVKGSTEKKRQFRESIDLQLNLKNYDPSKDKRFAGQLRLPNVCRPGLKVCVICDLQQEDQAKKQNLNTLNMDDLKKLNKQKKLVKKMCAGFDAFLASESIIKTIPRVVGPYMNRANKFPSAVALGDNLAEKVTDVQATIKFQLKKVLCMGCCIGHVQMKEDELRQNTTLAVNYFVSLLKKNWQSLKSAYLKSTMGKPQRLY
jgi:large subunit ribosomal protein L10Ae